VELVELYVAFKDLLKCRMCPDFSLQYLRGNLNRAKFKILTRFNFG
jgi:hypothetical protein